MGRYDSLPIFLQAYEAAAGRWVVPPTFHFWAALSLIATFASRNVGYEHIPGNPLHPNLYVFFIAKSAAGKGVAISNALRVVRPDLVHSDRACGLDRPYAFEGRTSPQALVSRLALVGRRLRKQHDGIEQPVEFYFVTPELGQSLDLPTAMASGFIKMMTGIYDSTGREWNDNTRTHGFQRVPPAYVNWIAGTTPDWLRTSVGELDFKGGFAGRIIPVYVNEGMPFTYKPIQHPAADDLREYLRAHLRAVRQTRGMFTMDADAQDMDETFARQRHEVPPGDERIHPFYDRGPTLAKKLAMVFSLARGFDLRIRPVDMKLAQTAVLQVEKDLPTVLDFVSETPETRGLEAMRKCIADAKRIPRRAVAAFVRRHTGSTRTKFLEYEATLLQENAIVVDRRTDEYVWVAKGILRGRDAEAENDA